MIFPHQKSAFEELLSRARTYFAGDWRELPIKPRFHSLICGPTGTGKTAIATQLASTIGANLLRVSANSWMPCGANNRGTAETMTEIAQHVISGEKSIIFIDELDKIWHETSWISHIKGEIFDLLDGRWPMGLNFGDDDPDIFVDDDDLIGIHPVLSIGKRVLGTMKLRTRTFIVAAGTFQDFFEVRSIGQIGFGDRNSVLMEEIDAVEVAKRLPRELTNRFNSGLVLLPALHAEHYHILAEAAANVLPDWIREEFQHAVCRQIRKAIATQKGCRFVEECILEALKFARKPVDPVAKLPMGGSDQPAAMRHQEGDA
jgi:hypothetical protein